jgi:hypothetical protein
MLIFEVSMATSSRTNQAHFQNQHSSIVNQSGDGGSSGF